MKNSIKSIFAALIFTSAIISLAGCGGSEPAMESETEKTNPADLFKDETPAYDAKAINPDAPVSEVNLKAVGNTMSEISYDQKVITVKAGTTIKLKFTNTSTDAAMPHNWVLIYPGKAEVVATAGIPVGKEGSYVPNIDDVLIATRLLGPQETTEITFPAPPAGKYQFICTYPGHWSVMNGELIVE